MALLALERQGRKLALWLGAVAPDPALADLIERALDGLVSSPPQRDR